MEVRKVANNPNQHPMPWDGDGEHEITQALEYEMKVANAQIARAAKAAKAKVEKDQIELTPDGYVSKLITTRHRDFMNNHVLNQHFGSCGAMEGAYENFFRALGTLLDYIESGEGAVLSASCAYQDARLD